MWFHRRASLFACLLFSAVVLIAVPCRADEFTGAQRADIIAIIRDAMKRDPSILRDAVVALQADDAEREKNASRAAVLAAKDVLVTENDPAVGNPRAGVTIIEFFDVRCPYVPANWNRKWRNSWRWPTMP